MKAMHGFTLIELMIGLSLSLILTFAVANMYLSTQTSFKLQSAQSQLASEGRYLQETLQHVIAQAGYRSWAGNKSGQTAATAFVSASPFAVGEVVKGDGNALYVRFTGDTDKNIFRCDNTSEVDYPSYKDADTVLGQKLSWDSVNKTLKCSKTDDSDVSYLSNVDASNAAVTQVTDFKLSYGVDCNADGVANYFSTVVPAGGADTLPATGASCITGSWRNTSAVRLCFVLKSKAAVLSEPMQYQDCGFPAQTTQTANDRNLYRTFVTTVYLRNQFD